MLISLAMAAAAMLIRQIFAGNSSGQAQEHKSEAGRQQEDDETAEEVEVEGKAEAACMTGTGLCGHLAFAF